MRLRLTLAVLLLASLPAFSQNFGLQLTGGTVNFGVGPMNITVSPNGGGTNGHLAPTLPPATFSCSKTEAVTLLGAGPFVIRGTTTEFGHQWEVEIVFPHPPGANQGNLSFTSTKLGVDRQIHDDDQGHGHRCAVLEGRRHVGGVPVRRTETERVAPLLPEADPADQHPRTIARAYGSHDAWRTRQRLSQICGRRWRVLRDSCEPGEQQDRE